MMKTTLLVGCVWLSGLAAWRNRRLFPASKILARILNNDGALQAFIPDRGSAVMHHWYRDHSWGDTDVAE